MKTKEHPDLACFLPQGSSETPSDPSPAVDRLVEQILARRQQEETQQRQRLFDQD
jgi:hypothetical protein